MPEPGSLTPRHRRSKPDEQLAASQRAMNPPTAFHGFCGPGLPGGAATAARSGYLALACRAEGRETQVV